MSTLSLTIKVRQFPCKNSSDIFFPHSLTLAFAIVLNQTLAIIPVYNEAENIVSLLRNILPLFPHVLIIDDGSSDKTRQLVRSYPVTLLSLPFNLGQGAALNAGFRFFLENTKLNYCLTLDGDGQHVVEDALKLLKRLDEDNVDIVFGTRFKSANPSVPRSKRIILWLAVKLERMVFKIDSASDSHNGLRAMTREACEQIAPLKYMRMAHATEIRAKATYQALDIAEEPVRIIYENKRSQSPFNSINILAELLFN